METGWVMLSAKAECKKTGNSHQNIAKPIHMDRQRDVIVSIERSVEDRQRIHLVEKDPT